MTFYNYDFIKRGDKQLRICIEAIPKKTPTYIPMNYQEQLQGYIYSIFAEEFPKLHDEGFKYENREFRHFTFSRISGKDIKFENKLMEINGAIKFFASFYMSPMPKIIVEHLIKNREFRIGAQGFDITQLYAYSEPNYSQSESGLEIKTNSPLVIYKTIESENEKKTQYLTPVDEEFSERVKYNLVRKYNSIYSEDKKPEDFHFSMMPLKVDLNRNKVITRYKGTIIEGYTGRYYIKCSTELFKIGYNCGFGSKNAQGFGMIEIVK